MKSVVVVTNLLPHYQIDFFNRFVELNPEIELVVIADIETEGDLNSYKENNCMFKVVHNKMYNFNGLIFRKNVNVELVSAKADRIIFYANPREISLTLLMIYYKLIGKKFYAHGMFHRVGGQRLSSKVYYRLIGFLAKKLFVYSRKGAEVLLGLGVDDNKINVVGTAINEKKSSVMLSKLSSESLNEYIVKYNLENKKIILQVVRLSKIKRPDLILKVAESLYKSRNDIVFILIGDGELYETMRQNIKGMNLESIVFLLGAIYDDVQLAHWFSLASLFVMPTCIGLSAHHAFSYGLPIVTDDNYLEQASEFDILSDGLNCRIYKHGDVESFKEAICSIVDDNEYQKFLSKNAKETVRVVNSLDTKCKKYFNAL